MTLEEAKKILQKEGFILSLASKVINQTGAIREFEKPEVCEAIKVANANKWIIGLSPIEWYEREKRLKKEHEKNNKESAHDKKSMTLEEAKDMLMKEGFKLEGPGKPCDVSECFIELESPEICEAMQIVCSAGYMIMMEVCDFNARKARLKEQLEEHSNAPTSGSPALKEAASQFNDALLDEQSKKIKRLTEKIARLKKIIRKKNMKIEEFRKESSIHLRGELKMFVKNRDLEGKLKDKDAVLSDVAEELRLSKIREKNLTEVCQKYMKENEELKKELADKVVDKIDAQALKSAESALAEKDEVIADLGKELAESKKRVEWVRNASKEYCEYGIAAEKMIQKLSKIIISKGLVPSDVFEKCRLWANGYRFNPQLPELSEEEEKKLNAAKLSNITAKCMKAARESINDVFESYAAKYAKSSLDDLKEKAYESFNAKAHSLGLVGSKDGNGLLNQMAGVDVAEEGADQSATIVQCGNGITLSKEEAEIVEHCTKNGTELHYSEKDGFTYTNVFGDEMPIIYLRDIFHVFTDEEIRNLKK